MTGPAADGGDPDLRDAHPLERAVGIEWYASDADGTGGRLRASPGDFRVREREAFAAEPVDADPGDYPYLVVRATLTEWDTGQFASRLSDALGASQGRVDWAGTKDRNAVTTQLVTLRDVAPTELPDIGGADFEVVGRAGRAIELGDLAGNDFDVVIRDADAPENAAAVTRRISAFSIADGEARDGDRVGVPNYFGQQRFGSLRPVTHEVGLAVARGDWEGAVLAYVGNPSEHEPPDTRAAREYVAETRDWRGALDRFPDRLGYERTILAHLADHGDDGPAAFREALAAVPWHLARLFVNAAQSYVFNRVVSERLARDLPFAEPVAGDVVCFGEERAGLTVPDPGRTQRVTAARRETIARHCQRGRAFVTAPLVGTETELADGEPGDIERAVLDDVGLAPADFALPDPFDSTGTRRAVLLETDLDLTRDEDALTASFSLPKGSYATVLLREYLKTTPLEL
jgi:tRNA pseudouridine13 synthase